MQSGMMEQAPAHLDKYPNSLMSSRYVRQDKECPQ